MKIEYWFEMPNKWTFKQPKLLSFISKYIPKNSKILIPFAGKFRFGDMDNSEFIYNDINHEMNIDYNIEAHLLRNEFKKGYFDCIIADPPYTHYQAITIYNNKKLQKISLWRETANYLLKTNGIYIELGYNSTGLRKEITKKIALGVCCLGGSHNDILIIVQRKHNNLSKFID